MPRLLRRYPCVVLPARVDLVYQDGRFVMAIPVKPDAHYVCRWCFGRPMPGCDTCFRTRCISAIQWMDRITVTNERGGRPPHFTCRDVTTPEDIANDRRSYVCGPDCPRGE